VAGGFRRGLFGFKREDVINYIESVHKNKAMVEKQLSDQIANLQKELDSKKSELIERDKTIENLNAKIDEAQALNEELKAQNTRLLEECEQLKSLREKLAENEETIRQLEAEVAEYRSRRQEIEQLSEGIGRLYLVARTNAQAILSNAAENANIISEEIKRNIGEIDATQSKLQQLRDELRNIFGTFDAELEQIRRSFNSAKENIQQNMGKIQVAVSQTESEIKSTNEILKSKTE